MTREGSHKHHTPHGKRRVSLTVGVLILLLMVGFFILWSGKATAPQHDTGQQNTSQDTKKTEPEAKLPIRDLQPIIDAWVATQSATYSIVVHDIANDKTIGSHLPDESYFAASLYKLFVAYLALMDFEDGVQNPDQVISSGQTRKQCVDKMIRSSDSPCGEAMMAAMGRTTIDARLKDLGMTGTSFAAITTSAADINLILKLIATKQHLGDASTDFLRDAMFDQPAMYRLGLAKGAPNAKVFSKVGWNEQANYHDVGIMQLSDGREYLVSILSQGNGRSAPLAELSGKIYAELTR